VLYEDPDNPIDPDRKPSEHRKTRRRRTDGPVVEQGRELDENDILAEDNDLETEYVSLPARLEYYDSEKKWREGGHPKKRIILKDCLDINRKKETANQFVIAIYTLNEGLDILFENDEVCLDVKSLNLTTLNWFTNADFLVTSKCRTYFVQCSLGYNSMDEFH